MKITFRGDSGFCRWRMLSWCERHGVDHIVGIARNKRLNAWAKPLLIEAREAFEQSGEKQRLFDEFFYAAGTWDQSRRVIVKAEHTAGGSNPRYVVTNLAGSPQHLYDGLYCLRGDMENRIKEQQLGGCFHGFSQCAGTLPPCQALAYRPAINRFAKPSSSAMRCMFFARPRQRTLR